MPRTAVMWFRRDLRVSDHPALAEACRQFDVVVPLFVWDPQLLVPAGPARAAFLARCVDELGRSLDGRLVTRRGRPAHEVAVVARACGADAVLISADFGPYGSERDRETGKALAADGRELRAVGSPYAVDPGTLFTASGQPFQVFTPFSRAWRAHGWEGPGRRPALTNLDVGSVTSHDGPDIPPPPGDLPDPGESAAHHRLDAFVRRGRDSYGQDRDRPDLDATSRLSTYLRFGCLHPRQLLARLEPMNRDHDRFASELCWREFYADVLHHRPDAARRSYRPGWERMEVDEGDDADERFRLWADGATGYPIVDAGMRQLQAEGWMPNRVRMLVASFLIKDLHLDWRRGAHWFMRHLVDGDLASNQLNWQWVAGSGNDAAPYFRVFNPITQGRRFDPHGRYVRRWVPELAGVPDDCVHEPWKGLPDGYPAPIVDHAEERQVALARYGRVRSRS